MPIHPDIAAICDMVSTEPDLTSLALATRLREQFDADIVAEGLTQATLRRQAENKFGQRAQAMFFTRDGLEQASRRTAAQYHASVFASQNITTIREIGPGIGGDTLAFAEAGIRVEARELEADRVEIARHNLADFDNVTIVHGDGLAGITQEGLWADPARRGPKGRIKDPDQWQPALSTVLQAAKQVRLAGIKVAPGIEDEHLPPDSRVDWISDNGDLIEAVLWTGLPAGRRAVLLGGPVLDIPGDPSVRKEPVEPAQLGRYVFEPDPAVIRADGISHLCETLNLAPIAPGIAYLTGDLVESEFVTAFEILDVLPLTPKKIASYCSTHNIGVAEIKKRGVDMSPEQLRAKLKLKGREKITLILSPTLSGRKALICRRVVLH